MNGAYLRLLLPALLPWPLGLSLLAGGLLALRLHRTSGSSRESLTKLLAGTLAALALGLLGALTWHHRALLADGLGAWRGRPDAQFRLAQWYQMPLGPLRADPVRAATLLEAAAGQGLVEAQCEFGRLLYLGRGRPRDLEGALKWTLRAAEGGSPYAMLLAGDVLLVKDPEQLELREVQYRRALPLLLQRAEAGEARASFALCEVHFRGLGLPPDSEAALAWLEVGQAQDPGAPLAALRGLLASELSAPQRDSASRRAQAWLAAHRR